MWDPGSKQGRAGTRCFAAGPPQGKMALQAAALRDATPPRAVHAGAGRHGAAALGPLGGQCNTRSDKRGGHVRGFTLIELLLVVSLIVMVSAGVVFSLRDSGQSQLEREAQRLVALLESARAQSRASGLPVYWHADERGFAFVGLPAPKLANGAASTDPADKPSITPWLSEGTSVRDNALVTLGPEPIIARQQIVLLQANQSLRIATDGLRPFALQAAGADETAATSQ